MSGIFGNIFKHMIDYLFVETGVEIKTYNTSKVDNKKLPVFYYNTKAVKKLQVNNKTEPEGKRKKVRIH